MFYLCNKITEKSLIILNINNTQLTTDYLENNYSQTIDNMNAVERGIKRSFDFFAALLGLILLSPVFLIIYIIQKIDGKGPVIFSQERIGKNGKPFRIFKFRTMIPGTKEDAPELAKKNDERLTKVGKVLREHHIDELPQLWNVLIGDMSFVGYRPELQFFIDKIMEQNPDYALLYCSRPGITSYAAIHNGYTYTIDKMLTRLDMDLEYLRKRTLWTDAKIIISTLFKAC